MKPRYRICWNQNIRSSLALTTRQPLLKYPSFWILFWTRVFKNSQSPLSWFMFRQNKCTSGFRCVDADVDVEPSTLAQGRGLACSSHAAALHLPTLENNRCHAIAERSQLENRWRVLINRANGHRAIRLDFPIKIRLPFDVLVHSSVW